MKLRIKVTSEKGVSLVELIVVTIIVGAALPFLLTLTGSVATHHAENEILLEAVDLASNKIEELVEFKKENADWADTITSNAGIENLDEGFTRITTVTYIANYAGIGIEVYEVNVTVSQPNLADGYSLVYVMPI